MQCQLPYLTIINYTISTELCYVDSLDSMEDSWTPAFIAKCSREENVMANKIIPDETSQPLPKTNVSHTQSPRQLPLIPRSLYCLRLHNHCYLYTEEAFQFLLSNQNFGVETDMYLSSGSCVRTLRRAYCNDVRYSFIQPYL